VIDPASTEDDLLARARAGDVDAFAVIVVHQAAAMRIAGGIAPSVSDAEEAVQDAFVKAYGALDRLRPGAPLAPWLMTIVSNEARNHRRSAGRREQLARRAAAEGREEAPSPEVAAVSAAERAGLRGARPAGPRRPRGHRLPLRPRPLRGGDCPGARVRRGTVKSRPSRALDRLRTEMGVAVAVLAVVALIAGLLAASPDARSTVLRWLGLEGARIERREPAVPPGRQGAPLDLGERVALGELRERQRFKIARPRLPALGSTQQLPLTVVRSPGPGMRTGGAPGSKVAPRRARSTTRGDARRPPGPTNPSMTS